MFRNCKAKELERKAKKLELKEIELKGLEVSIDKQIKELEEIVNTAKEYLALCGYGEEEIERIRIRNRFKVIK